MTRKRDILLLKHEQNRLLDSLKTLGVLELAHDIFNLCNLLEAIKVRRRLNLTVLECVRYSCCPFNGKM